MKIILTLSCLFCFSLLQAQQPLFPTPQQENTMLDLPVAMHQDPVDVFWSNETIPAKPYLHLAYLSARKRGFDDITSLVLDLQKQAQAMGANGIIVMEVEKKTETVARADWFENVEVTDMYALAIVYPDSLQFVPGKIKAWKVYEQDKSGTGWKLVATQPYSIKGARLGLVGNQRIFDWWQLRTHAYLLEAERKYSRDVFGRIMTSRPRAGLRAKVTYVNPNSNNPQIKRLRLTSDAGFTDNIYYYYEADGRSIRYREYRSTTTKDLYVEYPEYGPNGQIKGYLYLKKSGERSEQFMRADAEYYSQEDWEELVQETLKKLVTD